MTAAFVTVGANVRHWITFEVIDPTPEELATLEQEDSTEALTLASALFDAHRLEYRSSDDEMSGGWSPFEEHREGALVGFEAVSDE